MVNEVLPGELPVIPRRKINAKLVTLETSVDANTSGVAGNASAIVVNTASIGANASSLVVAFTSIAANASSIVVNANDISSALDWAVTGAINLATGSPTSVSLVSGLSDVEEIEIHIEGWSTNTNNQTALIRIGDSGGLENSGYSGTGFRNTINTSNSTGFFVGDNGTDSGDATDFIIRLSHMGSNVWSFHALGYQESQNLPVSGDGLKTLTGALDRVSITTSGGSATFDNGTAYARSR